MFHPRTSKPAQKVADVPMSPMIDIVFQLLIYFVFTFDPVHMFANLEILRPSAEPPSAASPRVESQFEIHIGPRELPVHDAASKSTFSVNRNRPVDLAAVHTILGMIAELDAEQTVVVLSSPEAVHEDLVSLLNLCALHELSNVSVLPLR